LFCFQGEFLHICKNSFKVCIIANGIFRGCEAMQLIFWDEQRLCFRGLGWIPPTGNPCFYGPPVFCNAAKKQFGFGGGEASGLS
jgi:hypothetical protein